MSNMENIDRSSFNALSNYGKGMKHFAIAKLIWAGFMIILTVFLQSSLADIAKLNESEMMERAEEIMYILFFVIVGFVGGGIYLIIRYLNYFQKLNTASKSSMGLALKTNFMIEIGVLATYIINAFLAMPYIIVGNLVTVAILITAMIYLGKWVISLSNHNIDENKINQMLSSINIMKIGLFVKIVVFLRFFTPPIDFIGMIIFYIGDIILIVGMLKTANVILGTFSMGQTEYSMALRNRSSVQIPPPGNEQYPIQPYTSTEPSSNSKKACPYCNSMIIDPSTIFCSVCGKKIA